MSEKPNHLKFTDAIVQALTAPPGKQVDYFDTRGRLLIKVSSGGTKAWRVLYFDDLTKKTKQHQIGRYDRRALQQRKDLRDAAEQARWDEQNAALPEHRRVWSVGEALNLARMFKPERKSNVGKTVEQVADEFVEQYVDAKGLRSADDTKRVINTYLKAPTATGQRRRRNGVKTNWAALTFAAITRRMVRDLMNEIIADVAARKEAARREGRKFDDRVTGKRQADIFLAVIRKMMNWFATTDDKYQSPLVRGMTRYDAEEGRRKRTLTSDEIRVLWKATAKLEAYGALVRMLLLVMQRRAKVATMKWADLDGDKWTIATAKREKGNAEAVRLPPYAMAIIERQRAAKGVNDNYVFPSSTRDGPLNGWSKNKNQLDKMMAAELPAIAHWQLHDLRRTARTLMSGKVARETAERVMGHKITGATSTEETYDVHHYLDEQSAALAVLANRIKAIVEPPPQNVVQLRAGKVEFGRKARTQ